MRLVLVCVIWIVIVGGLSGYVWQRDAAVVETTLEKPMLELTERNYSLEITPTFNAEEDPFALNASGTNSEQLEVLLNGNRVATFDIQLERGLPQTFQALEGVISGHNELYVKASPPVAQHTMNHGIRIRLFNNGTEIVDRTIWNNQGSLVSGTISFQTGSAQEDDHDH